jgi:hypothetical protein
MRAYTLDQLYGISLLVGAPLLSAADRRLLLTEFGFVVGTALLMLVLDYEKHREWAALKCRYLWTP